MRPSDGAALTLFSQGAECGRRAILRLLLGLGTCLSIVDNLLAENSNPRNLHPQPGDLLVFATGPQAGKIIETSALSTGGPIVLAWPLDPVTKVVRDGSRLNKVLLLKLEPTSLSESTRRYAAQGVVAYSAVCTHEGCPITEWFPDRHILQCPCHGSQYDPTNQAEVVRGPTTHRLAILPLKADAGRLVVANKFIGRLGAQGS